MEVQRIVAKKLDGFCKYLNREYSINSGGCCYVAYILASLLKRDGFRFKLIIWSRDPLDKTFTNVKYSNYHYGILLGGCFINGDGCHNNDRLYEEFYSKVRVTDILDHYNKNLKKDRWNDWYNIKQNPFIYKMLNMFYVNLTKGLRERSRYCLCS